MLIARRHAEWVRAGYALCYDAPEQMSALF